MKLSQEHRTICFSQNNAHISSFLLELACFLHSALGFLEGEKESVEKEKEDMATLLNSYEYYKLVYQTQSGIPQETRYDDSTLSTVTHLPWSEHKLMAENKSAFLVSAELVNKSKEAPIGTAPARRQKMSPQSKYIFSGLQSR